jgi:predicted  nucleic acid-binding Zn-ribbon protein
LPTQAAAVQRLAEVPLVDMARDVVSAVEAAQRHSATLQEQCTQLTARSVAAEEAAASLRSQLASAQSELAEARARAGSLQEQVTTHGASNGAALEAMGAKHAAEVASLKEQLTTKTQEARELSHMLRAWEAMRAGKDQQIAQLVELSRRFEEESHQKTRHMQALRQRASTFASPDSGTSSTLTGGASPPLLHHSSPCEAGPSHRLGVGGVPSASAQGAASPARRVPAKRALYSSPRTTPTAAQTAGGADWRMPTAGGQNVCLARVVAG